MDNIFDIKKKVTADGFAVIENVFTDDQLKAILSAISKVGTSDRCLGKTNSLFAIRQFFMQVPECLYNVFNEKFKAIISDIFGHGYFVVKSIYFDKPADSNWFVAYHQDLTISVDKKLTIEGYGPWTVKQNQFAVQPPIEILKDNFTIRIHLDDTGKDNGALRVIPESHKKGICKTWFN